MRRGIAVLYESDTWLKPSLGGPIKKIRERSAKDHLKDTALCAKFKLNFGYSFIKHLRIRLPVYTSIYSVTWLVFSQSNRRYEFKFNNYLTFMVLISV